MLAASLERVRGLPMPLAVLLGVASGGSVLGAIFFFLTGNTVAILILGGGLIFVALLLAAYRAILGWSRKRKANPLSQGLAGNAAAAPQGVSEPARRARLDDLRRNFEQGVDKFRAAGKNLYSVPWYVLVGEPGSGKTEAIRHCNVGFPPGLQDQLQGAGGTLNMNWWFTNQAIILDTAGRLMFEEIAPGTTNEWQEFLKLLKNNRPNCPINGMLLVIPVDTLIKDSADAIEKKATKIAQQFDQIQRILGVRFPVFVIITKCDLLNGFREFFDDLNDPQLQHQIMGWSNPAALDERFDPGAVTSHLETVKQRLVERRQQLLLDPVNTEDVQGRRIDQVDALYALPDSITRIGPRLRRYLEMIFVAGEWSPKPLFLRGIYFTSSMTEGSALDAELAEVLGVPVDSLPEGRVWRRDRAYFLRDLFLEKVFREKGLVTRAANADKQQRSRRAIILAFGFLAVILIFALTVLGWRQLDHRIGVHSAFWHTAAGFDPDGMKIIDLKKANAYNYDKYSVGEGASKKNVSLPEFFGGNLQLVQDSIDIPLIFRPMTFLSGSVNTERRAAYRALYEATILSPLYTAARARIPAAAASWSKQDTLALAQLMKLEYAHAALKAPDGDPHPNVELDPLFSLVLAPDDYKKCAADIASLQQPADWIYSPAADGVRDWTGANAKSHTTAILQPGSQPALDAISAGINATIGYWDAQTSDNGSALADINEVRAALRDYQAASKALLDLKTANPTIDKYAIYAEFYTSWRTSLDGLHKAADRATRAWANVSKGRTDNATLADLYSSQMSLSATSAQKDYDLLLRFTVETANPPSPSGDTLIAARTKLVDAGKKLANWKTSLQTALTEINAFDANYLAMAKGTDGASHHRFEVQTQLYDLADKLFVQKDPTATFTGSLDDAFAKADKDYGDASTAARGLLIQTSPDDQLSRAIGLCQFAIDASARAKKFVLSDLILTGLPQDARDYPAKVAQLSKTAPRDSLNRPPVPMATFPAGQEKFFDERFAPDVAGAIGDRLDTIRKTSTAQDASTRILEPDALAARTAIARKPYDTYRDAYIVYWRDTVRDELAFKYSSFKDFANKLGDVSAVAAFEQLKAYGDRMTSALTRVGDADDANAIKTAPLVSQDECKAALSSWINLGINASSARRAILSLPANDFRESYTVLSAKSNDSYIGRYWQRLPVAALSALVAEGQAEINQALLELAKYERFPLASPADPKNDLSAADVIAARAALEKIRGAAVETPAAGTAGAALAPGAMAIGQGGRTSIRDVDNQLDLLRGTNLLRDKQDYFDKLQKMLLALPTEAAKPFAVTFSVSKDPAKINDISLAYLRMVLAQGGKNLTEFTLNSPAAEHCDVLFPGGDVALGFKETPDAAPRQTAVISGPWAPFRLLTDPNIKSCTREVVQGGGTKWTLEYNLVDTNRRAHSIWFILEFKNTVPDLKDWPVPPRSMSN